MNSKEDVLDFIQRRFRFSDCQWNSGNCFYFALILKYRFMDGHIMYDTIEGHFLFLYGSYLFDYNSCRDLGYEFEPTIDDFIIDDHIVAWDLFAFYDVIQRDRIIGDCIE